MQVYNSLRITESQLGDLIKVILKKKWFKNSELC